MLVLVFSFVVVVLQHVYFNASFFRKKKQFFSLKRVGGFRSHVLRRSQGLTAVTLSHTDSAHGHLREGSPLGEACGFQAPLLPA